MQLQVRRLRLLAGVCTSVLAAPALACAQTATQNAAAPAADAPSGAGQLSEVIVTAQKREQNVIDVPITMTTYSGAFLDKLNIRDFHDLSQFTPGFYVQNQSPNNSGFVMRGITTDDGDATDEPRVSIFQDGVDISKSRGSYVELFDVQRVEIDKGPQSTLFGRSALTGAVDIIQNKASESGFDWNARVEGGDYDYAMLQGMVNIPLSDDMAVRFSGVYRRRDGYIPNLLGGDAFNSLDTGAVRMAVNWRPSDRLNTNFIFNYESDLPSGTSFKNSTFYPTNPTTGQILGNLSPYTGAALSAPSNFSEGDHLGIDRHVWGVTELVDFKINDVFRLSSITAFRHFDSLEVFDPDGFSYPVLTAAEDTYDNQVSQEFRLNFDDGHRLSGFVGVSGFGDQGKYHIPIEVDERAALALVSGALNRTNPNPAPLSVIDSTATTSAILLKMLGFPAVAPFTTLANAAAANFSTDHQEDYTDGNRTEAVDVVADATYRFTDQFQVSAGVRNSYEHKTTSFMSRNLNGASVLGALLQDPSLANVLAATTPGAPGLANYGVQTNPTANNGDTTREHLSDDGLSWRVNALYKFMPDASAYFTYARGRRPEVLSATGPATPGGDPIFTKVPAEVVNDYEGGLKGLLLDRHLQLDGAFFYYTYSNFQTVEQEGTQFVTTNAGSAKDYGFEGQATYRLNSFFDVFGTYTYTHARFDSGAYKGNHFRLTPDHMASIGTDLAYPALNGVFSFTPTYVYRSKAFFDDDNANPALLSGALVRPLVFNEYQNGYGLLDLRFRYQPDRRPWRLEAFVTNATDTHYLKDAGNTGEDVGLPTYIAGEPRMFGFAFAIHN
jgi:iron complex outermembrane recepter protein